MLELPECSEFPDDDDVGKDCVKMEQRQPGSVLHEKNPA